MKKQEYFSTALPHGLMCEVTDKRKKKVVKLSGVYIDGSCVFFDTIESEKGFSKVRPILRPLSDLTKKCVQADYNNGEPFIPLTELLKSNGFNTNVMSMKEQREFIAAIMHDVTLSDAMLLVKWHFDLITEDCEKVYVSENFNPY